jgi:hypothetical protein
LVSRYDTVTGKPIPIERRIGLLDRKIRVASENTTTCEEWLRWTLRAFQSVYAYEFQGDNNLVHKKEDGSLYNISFKFDTQTRAGEYGKEFDSNIKLDQFVDLNTGKMLEKPTFQPEGL